jgi:hydrogenase nickel incorporation protein HypB
MNMCATCGCGGDHVHDHDHGPTPGHGGESPAHHHPHEEVMGIDGTRIVRMEQDILARNDAHAAENRRHFAERAILALNLVSSPGSGKTTLLENTLRWLHGRCPVAVIEGDQQTALDAERIRVTGTPAVQINTGRVCHLDAHGVGHALADLPALDRGILFIENVGNLVCPALFDLGEATTVLILSVTEGEDKPRKYPAMFHRANLILINKIDLLPYLRFDLDACLTHIRQTNPGADIIQIAASTGQGMDRWHDWLERRRHDLLQARLARLEGDAVALREDLDRSGRARV